MHLCTNKDNYDNFELLKIENILIDYNYSYLGFIGKVKKINYDIHTGLFVAVSNYSETLQYIEYNKLLSHEPVFDNREYFLFKYIPLYV